MDRSIEKNQIRPDLADVKNSVLHLCEIGGYFYAQWEGIRRLWKNSSSERSSISPSLSSQLHLTKDGEFIRAVEILYQRASDSALTLARKLPEINNVSRTPCISDYVKEITSFQSWISEDKKVISTCEKIIRDKPSYNVDYFAIEELIRIHSTQLKVLSDIMSDINVVESAIEHREKPFKDIKKINNVFPYLKGLKWNEVTMTVISHHAIKIQARDICKKFTYAEMGFKDNRKGDMSDSRWKVLLEMAKAGGWADWSNRVGEKVGADVKTAIKDIRKRLQNLMRIADDPFENYRKVKGYKPKFRLLDQREPCLDKSPPHRYITDDA